MYTYQKWCWYISQLFVNYENITWLSGTGWLDGGGGGGGGGKHVDQIINHSRQWRERGGELELELENFILQGLQFRFIQKPNN